MEQTQNRNHSLLCVILLLAMFFGFAFGVPIQAYAEQTAHTVGESAEDVVFITFKKGVSEEWGSYLGASFFIPDKCYEAEFEYGVAVFPEKFIARYELYGDYIARKEAEGIAISLLISNGGKVENGRLITYNITHIPDKGLDMRLAYVLFVRNTDGEVAYKEPVISSFNETKLEGLSTSELLTMAGSRQREIQMEKSFEKIAENFSNLSDSLWIYGIIGFSAVTVIWGAYLGIRIAVAKKKEQSIDARSMVKRFIIGIIVIFVFAVALPLLIKGLSVWAA